MSRQGKNFWQKPNKPILALAPMAGITDSAFRQICKKHGADIVYSEMASATALVYGPQKTLEMLEFSKVERPYVVQLFGSKPEHFAIAAKLITKKIKPDGIDINFGCPVKKVQKQGAGAALMENLKLSKEIINSVINSTDLPVSIKTRTRVGTIDVLKFLNYLKDLDIKTVMIHGRTLKQGFSGEIDWKIIKKSRDYFGGIILANGGITKAEDAKTLLERTGADGVGIARGAEGRPWIFNDIKNLISERETEFKNQKQIFKIAWDHAKLAHKIKGKQGIIEMRKHLCWYSQGMEGARTLRGEFIKVETLKQIKKILS